MKNTIKILLSVLFLAGMTACEEFGPVFTGDYAEPESEKLYTDEDFKAYTYMPIEELKQMYTDNNSMPVTITENIYIKGQVISSDEEGNFYKGFVIQDETAGIEIKAGLTGLYNEYKLGQWVYVLCKGLTLGDYEGSKQLGYEDATQQYETAYIAQRPLLNKHVKKGTIGEPVQPKEITYAECAENLGRYVTRKNLKYAKQIFCLAYVDPNQNHKDQKNRIFLDEESSNAWGVKTWAMSQNQFKTYLEAGNFDSAAIGNSSTEKVGALRKEGKIGASAYSVTQYFYFPSPDQKKTLGVRSSGYARFSDIEINEDVIAQRKNVDMTGVLSIYDGEYQFTLIDLSGVKVHE